MCLGPLQGDAGKIGEAGSVGPPGQRVSSSTSNISYFISLLISTLHPLILCLSCRGRMERMARRGPQVQLAHP